ncbi:MAG TPA: hypothetical protein VGR14_18160, partial [Verrucomicrobiae bacterium]|nr:hypothetical protein [Verrucomicrobiae bacterium]
PRLHLFEQLGLSKEAPNPARVGDGQVLWVHRDPSEIAGSPDGDALLADAVRQAAGQMESSSTPHFRWSETNCLFLRRGPYIIAAGLDESIGGAARALHGRFVNLFDSELRLQREVTLSPGTRCVLLDIDASEVTGRTLLAAACRAVPQKQGADAISIEVEGVANTPGVVLLRAPRAARSVLLAGQVLETVDYDAPQGLLWVRFTNQASLRELSVQF